MAVLVDTGVLLRQFVPSDPGCERIHRALKQLRRGGAPATTFQNIAEFWNVSTRPPSSRGGYGLPATAVEARVRFIERRFRIITESFDSYVIWRNLVKKHALSGVAVHDARLAALVLSAGFESILTLNPRDFRRNKADKISCITPDEILS